MEMENHFIGNGLTEEIDCWVSVHRVKIEQIRQLHHFLASYVAGSPFDTSKCPNVVRYFATYLLGTTHDYTIEEVQQAILWSICEYGLLD